MTLMRARCQGFEILNKFPIQIAQFYNIFVQIAASRQYLSAKSVLPLLLALSYQLPFFFIHSFILTKMEFTLGWYESTVCKKTYRTKIWYVGTVRFKN